MKKVVIYMLGFKKKSVKFLFFYRCGVEPTGMSVRFRVSIEEQNHGKTRNDTDILGVGWTGFIVFF
jgi:hypothetical protein